jgi:ubiquinone/menaquinone biosynthesis C-methylase UbiE
MNETAIFFDALAADWDLNQKDNQEKIAAIATVAGIIPGMKIADIACGTGVLLPELLARNPFKILGIDISSKMIEAARKKFNDPRIELLVSDLFNIKETDFDAAIIYNAYPHFPDKRRLVRHVFDMLRDGGRVMVAHGDGREKINHHHMKGTARGLSQPLKPVELEAGEFSEFFNLDVLVDTPDIYMLSGIKK